MSEGVCGCVCALLDMIGMEGLIGIAWCNLGTGCPWV